MLIEKGTAYFDWDGVPAEVGEGVEDDHILPHRPSLGTTGDDDTILFVSDWEWVECEDCWLPITIQVKLPDLVRAEVEEFRETSHPDDLKSDLEGLERTLLRCVDIVRAAKGGE